MSERGNLALEKEERVTGRTLVESLFRGGESRSMSSYPLRVVYRLVERSEAPVRILVSVPKRCFKRAVKRNRVKRQVRESYRKHKHLLIDKMSVRCGQTLVMAFIWMDDQLRDSADVEHKVRNLLIRIGERL